MRRNRLFAIGLIAVGFGLAVVAGLAVASQVAARQVSAGSAVLGAAVLFIPVALLVGAGLYLLTRGGGTVETISPIERQRQLVDLVKARGYASLTDLAQALHTDISTIRAMIYQLADLQVFSGYADWHGGILYAADDKKLRLLRLCQYCNRDIRLDGHGRIPCAHCGTEYFLI